MTITHHPLHRSGRAGLTHPALALGDDAKSPQGIRMTDACRGQPAVDQPPHPLPGETRPSGCAAAACDTRAGPPENGTCTTPGRSWAPRSTADVPPRPTAATCPLPASESCMRRRSSVLTSPSFACILFRIVCRNTVNRPFSLLPADMREAEKVECLRLPLPGASAGSRPRRPELDQPRLLGMQLQPKLREALAQLGQEPLGVRPVLKPHDEVVRIPHDDHVAVGLRLPPPLDPEVEHVVQVDVGQERRCTPALWRSLLHSASTARPPARPRSAISG